LAKPKNSELNSEDAKGKTKHFCSVCSREITQEEYEKYKEKCSKCWNKELTKELDAMFGAELDAMFIFGDPAQN